MIDIEILIFAAVAIFVVSRLYAVLGKKTGAEPPPSVVRDATANRIREGSDDEASRPVVRPAFTGPGAVGMEEISRVDRNFDPLVFLRGAKEAYKLTVTAFAEGDRSTLSNLLDEEVYDAYCAAIDARVAENREPLRLLRLKSGEIADAELTGDGLARVTVSFEAELTDGEHQRTAKEIWTFERPAESSDPNWRLAEVSEAS